MDSSENSPSFSFKNERRESDSLVLTRLHILREQIAKQVPRACGCPHEFAIAEIFPSLELYQAAVASNAYDIANQVLCSTEVQQCNPHCAHRDKRTLTPDPFATEIFELIQIGVLQEKEWRRIVSYMTHAINVVDLIALRAAFTRTQKVEDICSLQQENVDYMQAVQERLLKIIDDAIAHHSHNLE